MDWRSVKFDWNRARAFPATAGEGSLPAALRDRVYGRPVTNVEAPANPGAPEFFRDRKELAE